MLPPAASAARLPVAAAFATAGAASAASRVSSLVWPQLRVPARMQCAAAPAAGSAAAAGGDFSRVGRLQLGTQPARRLCRCVAAAPGAAWHASASAPAAASEYTERSVEKDGGGSAVQHDLADELGNTVPFSPSFPNLQRQTKKNLNVVLVHPQIPGNTGSIARTCAATAVPLHLVEPLGFQIDDTKLKRAGLDYWPYVVVKVHASWQHFYDYFQQQDGPKRLIAYSKRGSVPHTVLEYQAGDWLLFGAETSGLPDEAMRVCREGQYAGGVARIPIDESYVRSLNLAVSVGIGVYEALRQIEPIHAQAASAQ